MFSEENPREPSVKDFPKILLVSRSLPFHHIGGMEAVAWDLARAFARKGCSVTVLTTACASLPENSEVEGVRIQTLPAPPGRYSTKWWWLSRRAFAASYANSVDVVFSVSAGALSMARRKGSSLPAFVGQIHGTAWGEFKSKIRQRNLWAYVKSIRNLAWMIRDFRYRSFDGLVAVGDAVYDDLGRNPSRFICGDIPLHAILNGVDPERFAFDISARRSLRSELGYDEDDKVMLSASRLHEQKGVMEGVEAFALATAKDPKLRYLIVGDGPDENRIRSRVSELGLTDKIKLLGAVPRDQMTKALSAADVFLFPTRRVEGLAMNVLEALACGLPAIVSKHAIDPRFSAIPIAPEDARSLAEAILAVERASPRSSRLPKVLTLDYSADGYLALMQDLVSRPIDSTDETG